MQVHTFILFIEVPMNVYMKDEIRSASLTVLDPLVGSHKLYSRVRATLTLKPFPSINKGVISNSDLGLTTDYNSTYTSKKKKKRWT